MGLLNNKRLKKSRLEMEKHRFIRAVFQPDEKFQSDEKRKEITALINVLDAYIVAASLGLPKYLSFIGDDGIVLIYEKNPWFCGKQYWLYIEIYERKANVTLEVNKKTVLDVVRIPFRDVYKLVSEYLP